MGAEGKESGKQEQYQCGESWKRGDVTIPNKRSLGIHMHHPIVHTLPSVSLASPVWHLLQIMPFKEEELEEKEEGNRWQMGEERRITFSHTAFLAAPPHVARPRPLTYPFPSL